MTWPCDSGINQDHKTKERSVSRKVLLNKNAGLGRQGGKVEYNGSSPPAPPFSFKFHYGPCTASTVHSHSKGFGGEIQPSTLPPVFALKLLICVIQSLIDSSWLLGMCFVVTHKHHFEAVKWVCSRNCWILLRFCCADQDKCCKIFLFVCLCELLFGLSGAGSS